MLTYQELKLENEELKLENKNLRLKLDVIEFLSKRTGRTSKIVELAKQNDGIIITHNQEEGKRIIKTYGLDENKVIAVPCCHEDLLRLRGFPVDKLYFDNIINYSNDGLRALVDNGFIINMPKLEDKKIKTDITLFQIENILKKEFDHPNKGYVDVSLSGIRDNIHIVVMSRFFDGMKEHEKQERFWAILDKEFTQEQQNRISLMMLLSPDDVK